MKARNIIVTSLVAVLSLASCTKNFEKINTNPNTITEGMIAPANCIEPILVGLPRANQNYAWYYAHEISGMTACTNSGTRQEHRYNINATDFTKFWDNYARYGFDANHMISLAEKSGEMVYAGIGKIVKAYCFYCLTTLYGDVPFKEAYMGSANLTPAFETQEEVYNEVVAELDSAVAILAKKPKMANPDLDPIYGGNTGKWIKFANSLRMRTLLYLASIDEANWSKIQEMVDQPSLYPVFESNSDNCTLFCKDVDPYKSYFGNGSSQTSKSDFQMRRFTELAIGLLVKTDAQFFAVEKDPRAPIWAAQNSTDKWQGTIGGSTTQESSEAEKRTLVLQNYDAMCRPDQEIYLMDYSEVLFIEAEGVLKGKLTVAGKSAKDLYEEAVKASIAKWAYMVQFNARPKVIKDEDVNAFLASSLASWDIAEANTTLGTELDALEVAYRQAVVGGANEDAVNAAKAAVKAKKAEMNGRYRNVEELLLTQKWLSLFYVDFCQFNEWRRTEYPRLVIGNGTVYNNYEYPTRFEYQQYTVSTNNKNVSAALARMGGANDMHTTLDWSYAKKNGGHRDPYFMHDALDN